ncbi:MAG: N-formylglutamate amidohydrolase [Hyphomicrobiaceae bacterium]|nr:N-formylglutamate amidohydrolase [Hyphomicrobiaceae bacterium]MCC0024099.1 N-formylglutamate amidohydrolase [Hyphomicrobiaceae bacterium]
MICFNRNRPGTRVQSDFLDTPAFETVRPRRQIAPLVFNSAHSGTTYPDRFLKMTRLDRMSIRQSEDTHVDELFGRAPNFGALFLRAWFPRAYLDVNREPYELDPAMFDEALPQHLHSDSPRVAAGLGTLARVVAENKPIYREPLSFADAQMRIEGIYRPYHATLQKLIGETLNRFGVTILIDCHSMPKLTNSSRSPLPDIVLGDRFGATCDGAIVNEIENFFSEAGLNVVRNKPYAGGYITRSYGKPDFGIHALQIEISRHLYMNESTRLKSDNFTAIKQVIDKLVHHLARLDYSLFAEKPLAAE